MASSDDLSRRVLIHHLTFLGGGVVLLGGGCKCDSPAGARKPPAAFTTRHKSLTNEEYDVMAAACDRILPRDQDPGALDAQVPEYIDRMLQAPELGRHREDFVLGLQALDRRARQAHLKSFALLPPAEQDALLAEFKDRPPDSGEARFYELLVVLTMEGFLGDPSYGGNKDRVGWDLVGFATSEPPVGYDGFKHLHRHAGGG
jgi:gluconate 2-dehydrogenase gamma chain